MPRKPMHPCNHAGCHALTEQRYCPAHAKAATANAPAWRTTTGSSTSRGYGSVWRRLRKLVLARDPFCMACHRNPSKHVDHIKAKANGGTDDMGNLRGLCERCHMRKTAKDGHARKALTRLANTIRGAAAPRS
ncbi:MAG: HNH endonuclease [Phycisphaerales bacterium]